MMRKSIILALLVFAGMAGGYAQTLISVAYEPATPMGDMRNFIENSSLRGLSGSGSYYLNDHLSLGLTVQWTGFYQKEERETWTFDGGAITANAWKEFYILPIYANVKYHFLNEESGRLLPYAGLGVGVAYIEQLAQVGTFEFKEKFWKFAFAPEVGTLIPMGMEKTWGFNIMLRYQMALYNEEDINMLQFLNYSLGVYWKIYPRGERY